MTIEWIRDAELPEEILAQMERAASGAPACEGIHVPCSITVRLCDDETIRKIKGHGIKAGLVIKPKTPASAVFPYLQDLDLVLVMTVEPGFGGQSFMAEMMPKIKELKEEIDRRNLNVLIEADGGIGAATISQVADAGVDVCVAGTAVFKAEDPAQAIKELQQY